MASKTGTNSAEIVATVAHLRELEPHHDDAEVYLCGYHAAEDGGGGRFYWDALSDEPEDGGTIFAVPGVSLGRWKRALPADPGPVLLDVRWFGARSADDVVALADATRAAAQLCSSRAALLLFPHRDWPSRPPTRRLQLVR